MKIEASVAFWNDAQMPYVETRRACQSRACYQSHSHPTFSIGAVDVGVSCFQSVFSSEQEIESGTLVVIPPHIQHSCNPMLDRAWSYQMMHLDAEWLQRLIQELLQDQQHTIIDISSSFFPQLSPQIIKIPTLYQAFTDLNQMLFEPHISIFRKEQYLIEVLTQILLPHFQWDHLQFSQYYQQHLNELISALNQKDEFVCLEDLSQQLGISRYAIIRLFKNNLGLTPHAYQLNHKINQARTLLKNGEPILRVAHHLGFTDQSHFHRVFKSHTGITPKQYQIHFLA